MATALASAAVFQFMTPATAYLPEGEEPKVFASMSSPPGYNIDTMAEIGDELRVTVVATGIGGSSSASRPKPHVEVVKPARVANSDVTENAQQPAASGQTEGSQAAATRTGYSDYDNPTVIRRSPETQNVDRGTSQDMDYLDIPAFLRRQAD